MGQASLAVGTPVTRRPLHLLKRMYPGVFDPRYAVNPSLEARLRHPCRRRPRIEHTGAPQITVVALSKCHWAMPPILWLVLRQLRRQISHHSPCGNILLQRCGIDFVQGVVCGVVIIEVITAVLAQAKN